MNLKYNKDGKLELEFDLHSLLEYVKGEDRVALIESLSCDEAIIKHVVNQILDGFTENYYHGTTSCQQEDVPRYGLDFARREISKRSSEIAKKTIEDLEKTIKSKNEEIRAFWE